jgi:site-specific DNA-methyltransferase (adenine-specific)
MDGKERPRQVQRKPAAIFNPTRREARALQDPAVVERLTTGKATSALTVSKEISREAKAERKAYTPPVELPDTCRLFRADIREGLPEIDPGSVDFIITDPPYPREYIPLYSCLSGMANAILKPGGSLIVMCGQSYLPEVMAELAKHMKYHWCLSYLTPGGQSPQLFQKRTNTFWKPVLWFVKGEYKGEFVGDVLKSPPNDNDKAHHYWGQSLGGFTDIVERFTLPGQTILDPFLGGGTTGVAAVTMGRKFIGTDIDQANIEKTRARIMEAIANVKCTG